jgi:hypothetical protein
LKVDTLDGIAVGGNICTLSRSTFSASASRVSSHAKTSDKIGGDIQNWTAGSRHDEVVRAVGHTADGAPICLLGNSVEHVASVMEQR